MVVASKDGGYGWNNGVDGLELGFYLRHFVVTKAGEKEEPRPS